MKFSLVTAVASLVASASAADLPSIEIVGNKFFYSGNGSQFYIRGVAYQSNSLTNATSSTSFNDPLADSAACKRDIPYLQQLDTNLIRVYAINTTLDHSECMEMLNDAGVYVISDLSEPGLSINRNDPQWNVNLLNRYTAVVDALANYTNVLGFFAGNEVTNAANNTDASPFVKAAIRDVKTYMKQKNYRAIPVGYSASDDAEVRVPEANYFACGDESEHADFYGVNMYEWCGSSNFQESGYEARTNEMKNMSIPLFFSEYGCNKVQPRSFQEVGTLYSDEMTDVWSGGIVYMYFQEENDYGLVSVSSNSVSTLADFNSLSSALRAVSPTSAVASNITTSKSTIACPASTLSNWVANTALPPTPDANVCDCISPAAECVVSDSVDSDDYGQLFGVVCGLSDGVCDGIQANATTGEYGAFSGCDPKEQLNYVINQYYVQNGRSSDACSFSGSASLKSNPSTNSQCQSVFNAVGTAGTGQLSQATSINAGGSGSATATSGSGAGSKSGSGKSAAASGSASNSGSGSKSASGSSSGSASSSKAKSKNAAPAATGNVKVAAGVLAGALAVVAGAI